MGRKLALLLLPLGIFSLDGAIKYHIDQTRKLGEKQKISGGKIIIKKYYNKGAALNCLQKRPKLLLFIHGAFLTVLTVLYGSLFSKEGKTGLLVSLGMILGGGFSNFYDRIKRKHVIDYISFAVPWKWFAGIVFNISDFFIFAGTLLTILFDRNDSGVKRWF